MRLTLCLLLCVAGCWEGDARETWECGDEGAACDDGDPCTLEDTCTAGTCRGKPSSFPTGCDDGDVCTVNDVCVGAVCRGTLAPNGLPCDDVDACTVEDACTWGACSGLPKDCTGLDGPCLAGFCSGGTCEARSRLDGTSCEDGDLCTLGDACRAGACASGEPLDCSALAAPCLLGRCVEGGCLAAAVEDGTACDDGVACTSAGACDEGECAHGPSADCSELTGGCLVGECNKETDACEGVALEDGTGCDDGVECTVDDVCTDGVCAGASICPCLGLADETECDDGDPCTVDDRCAAEVCSGDARDCTDLDDACNNGVCDADAGACVPQPKLPGTPCVDGDACTVDDACSDGVCAGAPMVCTHLDTACQVGRCDPEAVDCEAIFLPDDTPCGSGDRCLAAERCDGGACAGGDNICGPCEQAAAGEPCDDGNACTDDDACERAEDGTLVCRGGVEVSCDDDDDVCNLGVCDPETGRCGPVARVDGTLCFDGDDCTERDVCGDGSCAGTPIPVCDVAPTVCEPTEPEDDGPGSALALERGDGAIVVRGRIDEPGERDWYALPLAWGETLAAETLPDCGSRIDTVLSVFEAGSADVLAANDDVDDTPWSRVHTEPLEGATTLYVQVSAFSASGRGTYLLRLEVALDPGCQADAECGCEQLECVPREGRGECVPALESEAEPNDATATATAFDLEAERVGRIDTPEDVDVWSLELEADVPISLETLGFCGEVLDTELRVLSQDGRATLAHNDDAAPDTALSRIGRFEPAVDEVHFVEVRARSAPGRYRLVARDLRCQGDADCGCADQVCGAGGQCTPAAEEAEPNDTPDAPDTLAIGERKVGSVLAPGDVDLFAVDLDAGRYDIATNDYCGGALDTRLFLYAPGEADPVAEDDDSGEGRLSLVAGFEVAEPGRYLVAVRAYGFGTGSYVVEVRPGA